MIPELVMYRIVAVVMAVATVGFLGWVARMPAGTRRYYLPVPLVCATLSLGYAGMSMELLRLTTPDGQPVPMSRYGDYFVATPVMSVVAGVIAGATRRQIATLVGLVTVWIAASLGGYFLPPAGEAAANLLTVVVLGAILYVLLRPIARRARETTGDRVVLYAKLRNLLLLLWIAYLVIGIISRQGAGLLDAFTGVFLGAYLDVITRIGFGALVLRGTDATQQVVADLRSGGDPDEQGEDPSGGVPAGDADPAD